MKEYIPILIVFIFVAGFAVTNIVLSHVVGKRKDSRAKLMPYECGMDPVGSAHQRFSVKFYLTAILFILFDIEIIFMYPAVEYELNFHCVALLYCCAYCSFRKMLCYKLPFRGWGLPFIFAACPQKRS